MKSITVKELKEMQASGESFTLIDVREQGEYDSTNIKGKLVPKSQLEDRFSEIPKEGKVVIHCKSGMRSASVINWLEENHGYTNLYNLQGGIIAWIMDKQQKNQDW